MIRVVPIVEAIFKEFNLLRIIKRAILLLKPIDGGLVHQSQMCHC